MLGKKSDDRPEPGSTCGGPTWVANSIALAHAAERIAETDKDQTWIVVSIAAASEQANTHASKPANEKDD